MNRRSLFRLLTGALAALGLRKLPAEFPKPIPFPTPDPLWMPRPYEWGALRTGPLPPIGPGPVWRVLRHFHPDQRAEVLGVIADRATPRWLRLRVLWALESSRSARLASKYPG